MNPSPWNHREWGVLMFVENSRYIWTSVHLCQWNSAVWDCPKQWALYHQKVFRFCDRKEGTVKTIRINCSATKTNSYHFVPVSKVAISKMAGRKKKKSPLNGSLWFFEKYWSLLDKYLRARQFKIVSGFLK